MELAITSTSMKLRDRAPVVFRGEDNWCFEQIRSIGYDGVELHIHDSSQLDRKQLKEELDQFGLSLTSIGTGSAYGKDRVFLSSEDADVRQAAIERIKGQKITTEIREENYSSLKTLLTQVTGKLLRYSMIYYINHFHITAICNYNWVIDQIRVLYQQIQEGNREKTDQAVELLNSIDNIDFLKQLAGNLFLKMASDFQTFSTVDLAQWLTKMEKEEDLDPLRTMISDKFRDLVSLKEGEETVSPMVSQIYVYVEQHLQDSALTLKWIAENYLFMNVDYVSKKFYKETGQKFSQYLTKMRIGKAKELITKNPEEPVKNVAEQVGCGNNPQYFSQLFKKQTGMTPTDYITSLGH